MALPMDRRNTRGILTAPKAQTKEPAKALPVNPVYADALSRFSPTQQGQLSYLLDATAKSYGKVLSPDQVSAVLAKSSDFLKDIPNEGIEARTNRGMNSVLNQVKSLGVESEQRDFQQRTQTLIEEAMAQGTELSKRQLALLEKQTGLAEEELKQIQAARKESLAQAKKQADSSRTVADELYRQAGLKPVYDESGVLTGLDAMSEDELTSNMTELQRSQYQVAKQTTQKQLDALAGKFDMDPALQKSLDDQEKELRAVLEQKLGPNYMKSTAGIQAMSSFNESKTRIQESARLSWIQTGQGLVTSSLQNVQSGRQHEQASTAGAAATGAQLGQVGITAPLAATPLNRQVNPGEYGGVLSTQLSPVTSGAPIGFGGYQNVLAPMYTQRDDERQRSMMQYQAELQDTGSPWAGVLTGLVGTAAGMAITGGAGALLGPLAGMTAGQGTMSLLGGGK